MLEQHSPRSLKIGFLVMLCFACLSAFALVLLLWTRVYASALYVDGLLGSDSGNCQSSPCKTIKYAIAQAVNGDVISVAAGTYFEHLYISKNITINGAGAGTTAIDQEPIPAFPGVVQINAGSTVTITGVIIQNAAGGFAICGDGGVVNEGNLELNNVIIAGNSSLCGAGIYSNGNLKVISSTISNNHATSEYGVCGGLKNDGYLDLQNSSVINNQAAANGGGICNAGNAKISGLTASTNIARQGGGILNAPDATLTIDSSTISTNTATFSGGGLSISGTVVITNSTISGNKAEYGSAGIENVGHLKLVNATISGNTMTQTVGLPTNIWNGTFADSYVQLANTIINGPGNPNCVSAAGLGFISLGHNLSSDNTCNLNSTGDLQNVNPILGPLQLNSPGSTQTHALLNGSPAINAGSNSYCPGFDQRGVARPIGPFCDIGAFEFESLFIYIPLILR